MQTINEKILHEKQLTARAGGGETRVKQQQDLGKLTARERISLLLDFNSFEEVDQLATSPHLAQKYLTDGVICGFGTVNNRRVALYAQDFTIKGGSLGSMHAKKICKIMDLAAKIGCPIIGILDSGGARIDEGIHALAGYGDIMLRNTRYSGVIPQISLVLGPCAGGAVYSPALTDFIFTVEGISNLFITGPDVVSQIMGEKITKDALGGTAVHTQKSGVVHHCYPTEIACFDAVKSLLSFLPDNYLAQPPCTTLALAQDTAAIASLVPLNQNQGYDIKKLIAALTGDFFELHARFAPNIVVGLARLDGATIGIVANQPQCKAGALDIDASCKAARFVDFCDRFSIPILSLVDVPGFLPGLEQEHNGIIHHGSKLLAAYAHATVPKVTLIVRKAFGGAYIVMGSKHLGADFNFAWPNAQIAVLGAHAAIQILHKRTLATLPPHEKDAFVEQHVAQYSEAYLNPFAAAEAGYIDGIIEPTETRAHLLRTFAILKDKVELLPKKKN